MKPRGYLKRWQPKKWRPEYDRVVALSALGKSNVEIAEQVGFCKEYVSTILCHPEAKAMMDRIHASYRAKMGQSVPEVLDEATQLAANRVRQILKSDELFERAPMAVGKFSMDVLGLSKPSPTSPFSLVQNNNSVTINEAQQSDILDGLKQVAEIASTQVRTLRS